MEERIIRKIGRVTLDYTLYPGINLYSDGMIEDKLLEVVKQGDSEKVLHSSNEWPILYHLSDIRENIIEWCPFKADSEVLEIGSGCGAITGILSKKAKSVTCVELSEKRSLINAERNKDKNNINIILGNLQDIEPKLGKYDFITLIGVLEYAKLYIKDENPYIKMLSIIRKHLKEDGKLIIAIENKMGLKYINGAPEDHLGQPYVGINDYISDDEVRTFSSKEIERILIESGYRDKKFYYPVPDYKLPSAIFSSEYMPKVGNIRTYKTNYSKIRVYNFYEDIMNDQLASDEMFAYMANSYIVVAGNETEVNVVFSKYNRERKDQYRISTVIEKNNEIYKVIKKPLCEEARKHVLSLKKNEEKWKVLNDNIEKIKGNIIGDCYVSPYIKGKTLEEKVYEFRNNKNAFIRAVDRYLDRYYSVNEEELIPFVITPMFSEVFGDVELNDAKSLNVTNVDLVFSNIIIGQDNNVYVYDFEWVFDFPIPFRYVNWRAAKEVYYKYYVYLKNHLNANCYFENLGFREDEIDSFKKMEKSFGEYVCGMNKSEIYTDNYVKASVMPSVMIG